MLDSLNCLSQSACLLLEECARFAGWSLEFGGCPAVFLAFCGAACRSGRESQLLVVLGPSCILPDAQQIPSSASKRFPSLGKLHEQTNDTTPEPESSSESAPGCRLEIQARSLGDARPRRRTQPTISPSFSIRTLPTPLPKNKVPWPRSEQAPHLGHPPPKSHAVPPFRAAPHACTLYNWTGATWAQALTRRAGTASRTEKGSPAVCRPSP